MTRFVLLLMTGVIAGVAFALFCGDNLPAKAVAAVGVPKTLDAASICDCPAAEPPLTGRFVTISSRRTIPANSLGENSAACPVGSQLISGSCTQDLLNPYRHLTLEQSGFYEPFSNEWFCWFRNNEATPIDIRVSVTCLNPAP